MRGVAGHTIISALWGEKIDLREYLAEVLGSKLGTGSMGKGYVLFSLTFHLMEQKMRTPPSSSIIILDTKSPAGGNIWRCSDNALEHAKSHNYM